MGWLSLGAHISSKWWGKLRAVGGGSIHKLPRALPGGNVVLSPLGARRSTARTVAPGTYSTCSGGRWWAWFPRGGACGSGRLYVLHNMSNASRSSSSVGCGCPVCAAALRMLLSRTDLLGHFRCCRKGTWCVPTRWRACIWFGVTRTRYRVVPTRSRVVVLPVGPPPPALCRTATGPVSLHGWFVWMTWWWWGSRSCRWFHMRVPTLVGRPRW